jgi:DNA-binding beta-propeller fold protein YncE
MYTKFLTCFLALSPLAFGQNSAIAGPTAGYVFDSAAGAVRRIQGILGASYISGAVATAQPQSMAAVSSANSLAATFDGAWQLTWLQTGSTAALPGAIPYPAEAAFSASGTAVAFVAPHSAEVRIVTGLSPNTGQNMQLTTLDLSALGNAIKAFAVTDDGTIIAAVVKEPAIRGRGKQVTSDVPIVLASPGSAPQSITVLHSLNSLYIAGDGSLALATDPADQTVWRITSAGGTFTVDSVAKASSGVAGPVGAILDAAGGTVWIANADSHSVLSVPLNGAAPTSLSCGCAPTGLSLLSNGVFKLTEPGAGPLWVVETDLRAPQLMFVPMPPPAPGANQ